MTAPRIWIRKDREQYFLGGVIIACSLGGFVSSYWHFTDRISVKQDIKIKGRLKPGEEHQKLREVQYTPVKLKVGNTQYYRLEEDNSAVPALEDSK